MTNFPTTSYRDGVLFGSAWLVRLGWVGVGVGDVSYPIGSICYAAETIYCRRFQNMAKCIGCKFSDHLPGTIVFVQVRVQTVFE